MVVISYVWQTQTRSDWWMQMWLSPLTEEKDRKDQQDSSAYLAKADEDTQRFFFCNWSLFLSTASVALIFIKKFSLRPKSQCESFGFRQSRFHSELLLYNLGLIFFLLCLNDFHSFETVRPDLKFIYKLRAQICACSKNVSRLTKQWIFSLQIIKPSLCRTEFCLKKSIIR